MIDFKFENISEWKAIVTGIGDIIEDAMFICGDDGVTFRGMDASHVALLDVTFPRESFLSYNHENTFFSISILDFKTILNSCEGTVRMTITGKDHMRILSDGKFSTEYNLRLVDRAVSNTPLPKIEHTVKFGIGPSVMSGIISRIQTVSEYLKITSDQNSTQFAGKGNIGDATVEIPNSELQDCQISEDAESTYDMDYLSRIIRDIGRAADSITLRYGKHTPMHVVFAMPSRIRVEYYLAPRVEC